ncbi:N-acetylmuramic acid 6-phosphate etherase [Serinicoccus hydrothermalis]|uniref:N-acetylmuramic acid 6-phosphate etherase n=1 Tax=Serinicoccus hydrothermalis TaxID=1758689 RepID=A0A1B1N9D2_9MICO|nr:N-acetylmuramic acid 6-phosphate etherase [Serinicoccus hydrothermalis]ANS78026.1 N-acetylmuramic acid 6-phosphate etherase [Serinicoccus hydrothermalis]
MVSTTTRSDGESPSLLAVDLGKTGARVRWCGPEGVRESEGPGVVGLAAADGVGEVVRALRAALDAGGLDVGRVDVLAVGLVGYHAASARRGALAAAVVREFADVAVLTGDVTTTYVGALGDRPGVVVAAGTGAVALGADAQGRTAVRDGWGFLLGDDGSGYAVGRAGLRAALEHRDGRGGSAALERAATERFGQLVGLPAAVHSAEHPSRLIASFATEVARAAQEGDEVARQIWEDAAAALARTARACREALDPGLPVCLAGGLAGVGALLTEPFAAAVGGEVVSPAGTSLDGAEALARQVWSGRVSPVVADQVSVVRASGSAAEGAVVEGDADGVEVPEVIGALATEGVREDLLDLDERDSAAVLTELWEAEATVAPALLRVVPTVAPAVDDIAERLRGGGRMFYLGAGTPGRLAFVDASELPPTYGTTPDLVRALPAGGVEAMVQAREGAEDDGPAGAEMVRGAGVGPDDVVVGISASGRTPYVLHGLAEASSRGALTVAVSGNSGARASAGVDHAIEVPTGPEVISGSTRLKAGTAQKMLLGALSTAVMVRLGKTHGPFMVDMQASNVKLRDRAVRMVQRVTGCGADRATEALELSGWSTKVAVVMVLGDHDADRARELLARGGDSVRGALGQVHA